MPKLDKIPAHVPPELVVDVDVYALPAGDIDAQLGWYVRGNLIQLRHLRVSPRYLAWLKRGRRGLNTAAASQR